jgi:hypothetical protein
VIRDYVRGPLRSTAWITLGAVLMMCLIVGGLAALRWLPTWVDG